MTRAHDVSAESVLSLKPTVVLADTDTGPSEALDHIRNVGVPVVVFDTATQVDQIGPRIEAVAGALGQGRAVILRNHGVVVADADVRWAVLSAITLERAVKMQAIATALGDLRPISREDAGRMRADKYQDRFVDEYWAAWIRRVRRAGADHGMPAG